MESHYHYSTVSEALDELRKKGYVLDFNLKENSINCEKLAYGPHEFEITEIYRYEGDTDPADEATVYAIESADGLKGVLVTGYGANSDPVSDALLKKLRLA